MYHEVFWLSITLTLATITTISIIPGLIKKLNQNFSFLTSSFQIVLRLFSVL